MHACIQTDSTQTSHCQLPELCVNSLRKFWGVRGSRSECVRCGWKSARKGVSKRLVLKLCEMVKRYGNSGRKVWIWVVAGLEIFTL